MTESEQLADNLTVEYHPGESTGTLDLTVKMAGDTIHSNVVSAATEDSHHGQTQRGKFLNDLKEKVANSDYDAKPGVVKAHVESWFDELMAGKKELDADLRGEIATEIIEGTRTPVQVHGASDNNTTFVVALEFRGHTHEIEFAADDLLPGTSPGALESALINQYFERVDVPDEDWDAIAEYWHNNKEIVSVTEETAIGAKAERVVEFLKDSIEPTADKDKLNNSHRAAFVDTDNGVVWVQDRHYVDQIDSVASVDAKQDICQELRKRETLEEKSRRRWLDTEGRDTFWAFDPDRLGVNPETFEDIETDGGVDI